MSVFWTRTTRTQTQILEHKPRIKNKQTNRDWPQILNKPQKNPDPLCFSLSDLDRLTTQSLPIGHGVKERDKDDELERERTRHQEIELRRWKIWVLITDQDLGTKLFKTEIVRAIQVRKLFEKLQLSLAKLLLHQNCWLRIQRAISFNDHHLGLRESPTRTESYGESRAEWLSRRQWQRRHFEKWSCSEIVWYLFIYGVTGVWLVEILRRKKKKKSN